MDIIKSYLVGLGFQVNNQEYAKMKQSLGDASKLVETYTSNMAANYTKAAGIVVGALASITASTVGMVDKIAQADLNWQKFALRMYMTNDAARKLKITTDALGESLDDIAWLPELRGRYIALMNQAAGIEGRMPTDMEGSMRSIRDIRFEFTRMKVEATYSIMYISYYLQRYLGKDVKVLYGGLRNINDWITAKMPEWTAKVAGWLSIIIQLGGSVLRPFQDLTKYFSEMWNTLSKEGKIATITGVLSAIFLFLGPTGKIAMGITGLILLIDDFYAYLDGRKSSKTLAPIWHALEVTVEKITKMVWLAVQGVSWVMGKKPPDSKGFMADMQKLWTDAGEGPSAGKPAVKQPSGNKWHSLNEIYGEAGKVSKMTGIPASWIYGQWHHETGGFTNRGATQLNNFAGLKGTNGQYLSFGSIGDFSSYFAGYLKRKQGGALGAQSPEEYAAALKKGGYYEDTYNNYSAGIRRGMLGYSMASVSGGGNQTTSIGDVNVYVTQPNASAAEIASAVHSILEQKRSMGITRGLRDAQGVYP